MDKKFRVAHIGCGVVSECHLKALTENEDCEVVALCDKNFKKAEDKSRQYSLNVPLYTDYKEMLDKEKLDCVHIATPHFLHCEMACEALSRGINVFLEKPMCINKEEIETLILAEKNSTAKVCVCFQNRFNPTTVAAKKISDADGGVLFGAASVFWYRGGEYYTGSDWRGSMATEGGGVMINQAIHSIDLLTYFLGKPTKLSATVANHHNKGVCDTEDSCEGIIKFDRGGSACFYATTAYGGGDLTVIDLKTKNHKIKIDSPYLYLDGELFNQDSIEYEYVGKECYGNGHKYIIGRFYSALKCGEPIPVTLEEARYAIDILLAAYKSNDNEVII